MTVSQIQNFYKATITRTWSATTGDFNVSIKPTVSSGYLVISPNNTLLREIVYYTATGTNAYGDFVTISNIAHRGLGGTSAQIHNIGEPIRMNITAQHWDDLIASAVAPTVNVGTTTTLDPGSDATATNSGSTVAAVIDFAIPAGSTIYSGTSIPDNSVGRNGDWAFDTSVNCYVWYKSGGAWALVNSLKGATGDGNGIASIVKTGTVGIVDTYTITYDDATTSTFNITNGEQGVQGDAGVSVVSIIKTDTVGLVDTYTITYSNTTTSTFDVTNGQDGTNGLDGTDGIDGTSFLWQGAYDNVTAYKVNDAVSYNGSSYMCKLDSTGNLPTNTTYWDLMAQKGLDGTGSGDMILADAQSVTGLKTFDTTKLAVKGSSTGKTAIASANASATDYTATLPAKDGTIAMTSDIPATPTRDSLGIDTDDNVTFASVKLTTGAGLGKVLTSDADGDATWETASGGTSLWTAITATRVGNTSCTVVGDQTAIFKKGMIIRWTESAVDKVAMVSIPSTVSTDTTITFIGDTMASIDSNSFKYSSIIGAEQFVKNFAVAGNIGAVVSDVANAYYATEPMRVIGADLQVGTAGTTNSTTIDINKGGNTMFTTKPTLATTVASSPTPFTADTATSLALGDRVSIDIDAVQTTNAIDLYVQLYLLPTRYLSLS